MKKLGLSLLAFGLFYFSAGNAFAQADKVPLPFVPKPNQTSRRTMTQEMVMNMTFDGELPEALASLKTLNREMKMKSVMGIIQKNGPMDKDGRLEVEISFDQADIETSMNGSPLPARGDKTKTLVGKKFKIVVNGKGEVLDFSFPDGVRGVEIVKQLIKYFNGNYPKEPMSIGQTAIIPYNLDFPLPWPGVAPMKFDGQVKTKLVAVDGGVDDRIAKFEQAIDAKIINNMNVDLPSGNGKFTMNTDIKMIANGGSQVYVDRGLVKYSEMNMVIDGKIGIKSEFQLPDILIKGTFKVSIAE
ncbi:MAG: hypothetical protein J2P31_20070 [Blastocatellia bacterium]|nr:hypothetical protein [Blastocatellia bacterium]